MGEVYRATDTRLGRDVAVKILPERLASDPSAAERFDREARAVAALSHPNIMAIHDIGREHGVTFAVTELLEGETLRDRLAAGRIPLRKAVDLATQIAQGLAAAHAKGIIHRDLKPENIFLTRDGHAKILDFGLAKVQPVGGTEQTQTAAPTDPGTVMGTTGYLSPEQAQARPIDTRSDIFSFGAVFYEMIGGTRAFKGDSTIDTLHSIVHNQPPPISSIAPDVPTELRWILDKCLAKDPDERYQSTRDLVVDLKNAARTLDSSPALSVTSPTATAHEPRTTAPGPRPTDHGPRITDSRETVARLGRGRRPRRGGDCRRGRRGLALRVTEAAAGLGSVARHDRARHVARHGDRRGGVARRQVRRLRHRGERAAGPVPATACDGQHHRTRAQARRRHVGIDIFARRRLGVLRAVHRRRADTRDLSRADPRRDLEETRRRHRLPSDVLARRQGDGVAARRLPRPRRQFADDRRHRRTA